MDLLGKGADSDAARNKACRIRDYQDTDEFTLAPDAGGTGDDGPRTAGYKNYYYDTIREIQKVTGINADTDADSIDNNPLAEHSNELTVYSHDPDTDLNRAARLNLNTASIAEIAAILSAAGEPLSNQVAYSIYTPKPLGGKPIIADEGYSSWQTVGQGLYSEISVAANAKAKIMKKVADKFTVAPAAANPVYYKPATNPNLILGAININTAPKWALCSLIDLGPGTTGGARQIIQTRHGDETWGIAPYADRCDGAVQGTALNPFTYGVADDGNYGRGEVVLTREISGGTFVDQTDQVTVRSDRFRIVSTGVVGVDGDDPPDGFDPDDPDDTVLAQRKIEVAVDRHFHDGSGQGFEILYWSETVPEY